MCRYFWATVFHSAFPASAPCLVFVWNLKSDSSKYVSQKPSKSDLDINNQMFVLDEVSDSAISAQPGDAKQRGASGGPLKSELSSIARTALRPEQLCSFVVFLSRSSIQGSSYYEDETTSPYSRRTGGNYFCPMLSSRVISFSCVCCLFSKWGEDTLEAQ